MPVSTFLGLETTLRGILAQQLALDVTGHNISNANTVGYSRQAAVMAPTEAYTVPGVTRPPQAGQLGTGVNVQSYQRMRDEFLDIQYRAQSMRQGSAEAAQDGLRQIEVAVNEPSDTGLNSLLQSYWASWHDVSNAPENLATRQALAQNASSLANGFQSLATQLQTVQSQVGQNVTDTISQVNAIGSQITQLTAAITADEVTGDKPNDLLDQRDVLIDQLSKLGNVTVTVGALDTVDITIGGATLVSGGTPQAAIAESDMTTLTSGKLNGLIGLRDTTIPGYQASLDSIASTLITQTNTAHAAGFDLAGNAGGAFFNGTDAATISVNPALLLTPALIAASANGQPGNAGERAHDGRHAAGRAGRPGRRRPSTPPTRSSSRSSGRTSATPPRRPTTRPSSRARSTTSASPSPASRSTRRCRTSSSSSAATRHPRVPSPRWTR